MVGAKRGVWGRKGFSVGEEESALGLVLRRFWLGMIGNVFFCSERVIIITYKHLFYVLRECLDDVNLSRLPVRLSNRKP